MNSKVMGLMVLLLLTGKFVLSQCNNKLVEEAAQSAGTDAVYIRDFKVKLSEGTMDEPSPTGKFPVYLNKGVTYRFSVANANEFEGKALVEISRRDQVLAGNYDFSQKIYSAVFDFECSRSSSYQILISYGEGKEGCSAIVMSMVLQDSMAFIEPGLPSKSDSAGTLYLFTDNELQIASSAGKNARLDVTISQGTIEKKGQYFIARPAEAGEALIKVVVKNNGEIVEQDSVIYKVDYPPLPIIQLPDEYAGTISLSKFSGSGNIQLTGLMKSTEVVYQLKQFSISMERNSLDETASQGNKLSAQQVLLIKKSKPGTKIYIQNALFLAPDGITYKAIPREVLITE